MSPVGEPELYKTYRVREDRTETTQMSCADYGCRAWQFGYMLQIDESTDLGKLQAAYIRSGTHGLHFETEYREGGLTEFRFPAGQRCFEEHRVGTPRLLVQHGNHLRLGPVIRRHTRPEDWVEDMQEQIAIVADDRARG